MIKALILIHVWSLVVAGGAWALQRDGKERVGARFPAPNTWLILILLSFLPGILYFMPLGAAINIPDIEMPEFIPTLVSDNQATGAVSLNFAMIYMGICVILMSRTLWQWSRLQRVPLVPTTEPDVYTSSAELPPLTLSWPRRAVVIPEGFTKQAALIRHERAHLRRYDAEVTLLLLLLQDVMLRNPGVSYLVRQWRLAIELRADRAATKMLSAPERKDYAALLLNIARPSANEGAPLPCPTAQLNSARHRSAKMRLVEIMENGPNTKKRQWGAALVLTFVGASGLGLMSAAASVNGAGANAGSDEIDYVVIDYVKKTPSQMPARCPGLIADLKSRGVTSEDKELTVNGELVSQKTMNLGTVILSHDVQKDGRIINPRILNSTLPCFETEAKIAIVQWMAGPQASEIKNVAVKLPFIITGETNGDLNQQLKDLDP